MSGLSNLNQMAFVYLFVSFFFIAMFWYWGRRKFACAKLTEQRYKYIEIMGFSPVYQVIKRFN